MVLVSSVLQLLLVEVLEWKVLENCEVIEVDDPVTEAVDDVDVLVAAAVKLLRSRWPQSASSVAVQAACPAISPSATDMQLAAICSHTKVGIEPMYAAKSGLELFDAQVQS